MKWLLLFILFGLFIIWTYLVVSKKTRILDEKFYRMLKFSDKKALMLKIVTNLANTKFLVVMCVFLFFLLKNKKLALSIILIMLGNAMVVFILKHIIKRERPNINRLVKEKGYSYPSGHTFSSICFYGLVTFLISNLNILLINKIGLITILCVLILLIGFSRIYLGVHYFSDVVGGLLIGCFYIILCVIIMLYLNLGI